MPSVPILETPRLRLRSHEKTDLPTYLAMRAHPNVFRFTSGRPFTQEEAWQRIIISVGQWLLSGFGVWAIEDKASGDFIGELGFNDARRDGLASTHGIPEAGWLLAADRHGKGYATEAVRAIHEWGDAHFADGRTVCAVRVGNQASIRLAERIGYRLKEETVYRELPVLLFERNRPL
ncbi:MAG TPA: GNAT family N-acetyltransferase [Aliidongia sp.]|nr:GNAT family N-acetyltransferase [Aliidongia sp.]